MILIPMAGESRRFAAKGYDRPKYMLELDGRSVFDHAVGSFRAYFADERFVFVAVGGSDTLAFIDGRARALGIARHQVVMLDRRTSGQGETVLLGVSAAGAAHGDDLTIFNIDTFRPGFRHPDDLPIDRIDGYLETFIGSGKNWSNVEPAAEGDRRVARTAEKQEISQYCCTGLYWFRSARSFTRLAEAAVRDPARSGESYVAPMYNALIAGGGDVRYTVVPREEVIFCGVPEEYEDLLARRRFAAGS